MEGLLFRDFQSDMKQLSGSSRFRLELKQPARSMPDINNGKLILYLVYFTWTRGKALNLLPAMKAKHVVFVDIIEGLMN